MSNDIPEPDQPLQPFARIYADLFTNLTVEQARLINETLALGRLEGDRHTRQDVADLIAVVEGRMSEDEYRHRSL